MSYSDKVLGETGSSYLPRIQVKKEDKEGPLGMSLGDLSTTAVGTGPKRYVQPEAMLVHDPMAFLSNPAAIAVH